MTVTIANRQRARRVDVEKLRKVAIGFASRLESVSIVLVSDAVMARYNLQYHATAGSTDILTFDYGAGVAELIISVERAHAQARQYRSTLGRELALYVIHGLLHLHGYDDRTAAERRRMRAAERRWLRRLLG